MIAILGAGISGLSLAHYLRKAGKEVIVLEKAKVAGGKMLSVQENGFTLEAGPNTVLLNNVEIVKMISALGLKSELIFADPKNISKRYVLYKGKPTAIPNGPLSALSSPLIGFQVLRKVVAELRFASNQQKESLASLVKRHFGNQVYENLIVPMLTGIYAGDPEKMDADYVLPFLKKASREHGSIIKGMMRRKKEVQAAELPKQKIFTFKDGLQVLPSKLAKELEQDLWLDCEVTSMIKEENGFRIEFKRKGITENIKVDQLVSTIPANALKKIENNFLQKLLKPLSAVPYVPAVVLHLGYPKAEIGFKKKAFGLLSRPEEKVPFLGILFNSRFFPHTAPNEEELLTIICGGEFHPEIAQWEDNKIFKKVESSIENLLSISGKPTFKKITSWQNAIPQYYLGHQQILEDIQQFEESHPGFHLAGNFINGISVSDCIKNAKELAEKIIVE